MGPRTRRRWCSPPWAAVGALAACLVLGACGSAAPRRGGAGDTTCRGKLTGTTYIRVWFHASASVGAERQTMVRQVAEFNRSQRLVRFGPYDATDMGSWQWGITANATNGVAAWRFIAFLLRPAQVVQMTHSNGAIPGTYSALRLSPRFAPGGPEHLYVEQLEDGVAKPRPQTPAYPALTAAFAHAFQAIVVGRKPVKPTLDAAARSVTADLIAHDYYAGTGR
jgi:ABC-type glycerol-3-phosphate transport system substrate-binding protein